jgi:putative aldouronate transport system substrate-binding protein
MHSKNRYFAGALFALAGIGVCTAKPDTHSAPVVPLEIWYGATASEAGAPPADWSAYRIIREKLGIEVKLTALPSNESDSNVKINAAGAARALPDLFMVSRDTLSLLIKNHLVAPVDTLYPMMPHRTSLMYDDDSRRLTTVDGHSYGLAQPGSIVKNEGILIRKDWLDKLGLAVPVTLADYMNVMKAFTFRDPDGNGKNDTWGYGAFIETRIDEEGLGRRLNPFFGAFGVPGTFDMTQKGAGLMLYKPAYYDALAYVKRMIDEKVIDPNWLAYKKDDFRGAWKQGRFGIMREQNAAYALEAGYSPFDKNFPDGQWIVIDPPKGPSGLSSVGNYTQGYRIYAVSAKTAKNPEKMQAIARLLEWMSSDEGYYLLGYGEKNINYRIADNGSITTEGLSDPSKAYSKPEQMPVIQLRNLVFYNGDVELDSRYPAWTTPGGKKMSALVTLREMQQRPWTPAIGADTLPAPNADVKRFYEQGVVEFVTGQRELTPAAWKNWLADFDRIGGRAWNDACVKYAKEHQLLTK